MKTNIEKSQKIIEMISCFSIMLFLSGCALFVPEQIADAPEIVLYSPDISIPKVNDRLVIARVDVIEDEEEEGSLIADPSMDIENEFFFWAANNVKTMDNMQIAFFSPEFYGFRSNSNNSATKNTSSSGSSITEKRESVEDRQSISLNVSLSDTQKAWLSASTYISESDVLTYKSMSKDSMDRLDYYWILFNRANCEMNNYQYDCAKSLYDSNPDRYTPKDYYDERALYRRSMVNDKEVVLVDTFFVFSAECFEESDAQKIAKYGAKYAADYLRLIGVD